MAELLLGSASTNRRASMVERATETINASREVLEDLSDWSEPLQVKAEQNPDGTWELIFRRVEYEPKRDG